MSEPKLTGADAAAGCLGLTILFGPSCAVAGFWILVVAALLKWLAS